MIPGASARDFRVIERNGPAGRLVLRGSGRPATLLVLVGYRGAALPDTLTGVQLSSHPGKSRLNDWRLSSREGIFDFEARAVDQLIECPELFLPLLRPFALRRIDRLAARLLLAMLRFPGGARLMRRWHAGRGR